MGRARRRFQRGRFLQQRHEPYLQERENQMVQGALCVVQSVSHPSFTVLLPTFINSQQCVRHFFEHD